MPIYEYEHVGRPCILGKVFDFKQSLADDPLVKCPECSGGVKKIISQISISLSQIRWRAPRPWFHQTGKAGRWCL
jgi:putative FmdB family regulatory protein